MLAQYLTRLALDDEPLARAEGALDELIIVDLPEEADPLAVLTLGTQ